MAIGDGERGYAMAALLVAMTVMAIVMATAMPTWRTMMKREREAELVFRGEQYARAIALYQRRSGQAAAIPPSIDVLIDGKFLRKKYKDPMTGQDFKIVTPGTPLPGEGGLREDQSAGSRGRGQGQPTRQPGFTSANTAGTAGAQTLGGGGVLGVVSTSTETSLRLFNGRDRYDEWVFTPTALSNTAGINPNNPGVNRPGIGPDGRPGNASPFPGDFGGGSGGNRGGGARGQQQPARPGTQQPARPGGPQQPQAPVPRSPFGGGRSPF
jgi:type II secretory pathway pseudopilin PulG